MIKFDVQQDDFSHLEELTHGFAYAEVVEIALKKGIFSQIELGEDPSKLPQFLGFDEKATSLFLKTLERLGLIGFNGEYIFNTPVATKYLTKTSPDYALDKLLQKRPNAKFLGEQLLNYFAAHSLTGEAKNATEFPEFNEIIGAAQPNLKFGGAKDCTLILAAENYVDEIEQVAAAGFIVIISEFIELNTAQSAANALHNYCRNSNAPILKVSDIIENLADKDFVTTPLIPLSETYGLIIGARSEEVLNTLTYSTEERLMGLLKSDAVASLKLIKVEEVVAADWVADHCRWGCSSYGGKCCPPLSPTYKETETRLTTYHQALLIEGKPPMHDFQKMMLESEKIAFKAGFYKAFAYWAGPCSLCTECKIPEPPKRCTATRPSMESAGIDVFATVRNQGYTMETLKDKKEFAKFFGLLLLN